MADLAVDYTYRYRSASRLDGADGGTLHLATSGGPDSNPRLFRGRVAHPVLFADALLAIGAVARSRFHVPPAMLARILLLADPVATVSGDALRFEAFSSCASVYARLDLLPAFVDGEFLGVGSTNVDLGSDVRAALAGVTGSATLDLEVGLKDLAVEVDGERHEERKVALPSRWVRGFAETQAVLAAMDMRLTASGAALRRLLRDLPRGAKDPVYVAMRGSELTLTRRPAEGAVAVADADRLRVLERLVPSIASIAVHASADGSSAWVAHLADARFTLAVSPAAWRGFSGEGRVVEALGDIPGTERPYRGVRGTRRRAARSGPAIWRGTSGRRPVRCARRSASSRRRDSSASTSQTAPISRAACRSPLRTRAGGSRDSAARASLSTPAPSASNPRARAGTPPWPGSLAARRSTGSGSGRAAAPARVRGGGSTRATGGPVPTSWPPNWQPEATGMAGGGIDP